MKRFHLLLFTVVIACQSSKRSADYKKVSFESYDVDSTRKAIGLTGYLFKPQGEGPFPAIVALHGCAGLFGKRGELSAREMDWGRRLSGMGFVVLYPDSFSARGMNEICTHKELADMPRINRPRDAYGALKWLANQAFVRKDKIGIMGWSNGGSTLLWTLNEHNPAPAEIATDFKYAITFYPGCRVASRDPDWAPRININILMGELDNWTLPRFCQDLAQKESARGKIDLTLYPNAYHDFDHPHMPLQQRHGLAFVAGGDSATIGTNVEARAKAIEKVRKLLSEE